MIDKVADEGLNQPEVVLKEDEVEEEPEEEPRPGTWGCQSLLVQSAYYLNSHSEPTPKQFTVLLIKPDAVKAGRVDEIVEKVFFQPKINHNVHSLIRPLPTRPTSSS